MTVGAGREGGCILICGRRAECAAPALRGVTTALVHAGKCARELGAHTRPSSATVSPHNVDPAAGAQMTTLCRGQADVQSRGSCLLAEMES